MDGALIERARKGDADAFDEVCRQRIDSMYRTALGILGNPVDARDATQETLLSAWRSLRSLRDAERFDAWLHRITVNAAKMVARKRRQVREVRLVDRNELSPELDSISRVDFDHAFERLSIDQRALLLDHYLEGRSISEIASRLEIPDGTVKSRLHAARAVLARALREADT